MGSAGHAFFRKEHRMRFLFFLIFCAGVSLTVAIATGFWLAWLGTGMIASFAIVELIEHRYMAAREEWAAERARLQTRRQYEPTEN